jgi:hypothetical protein
MQKVVRTGGRTIEVPFLEVLDGRDFLVEGLQKEPGNCQLDIPIVQNISFGRIELTVVFDRISSFRRRKAEGVSRRC